MMIPIRSNKIHLAKDINEKNPRAFSVKVAGVDSHLLHLWELRLGGRVEEVRAALRKSRTQRGEAGANFEILRASLLRYDGQIDESDRELARIENGFSEEVLGLEGRFLLSLQRGLNLFVRARYAEALQLFLIAQATAPDPLFAYTTKCNILWCFEYLGLPTKALAEEISGIERGENGYRVRDFREQTSAFALRTLFRERKTEEIRVFDPTKLQGQARLTWLWCLECLVNREEIAAPDLVSARTDVLGTLTAEGYQRDYVFGTFLGTPGSTAGARLKDVCDRLYLWTWRWLMNPGSLSVFQLRALKQEIQRRAATESLGSDDFQQWRNAVLWIGLFEGKRWESLRDSILGGQPYHRRSDPYYEAEYRLLEKIFTRAKTSSFTADPEWRALPKSLRERIRRRALRRPPRGATVIIDREIGQIWNRTAKKKTSSERLMRLVLALHERSPIPKEEAMRISLGIRQIDPVLHAPSWSELLSRARAILPASLRLRTRGGYLVCEGSWRRVALLGGEGTVSSDPKTEKREVGRREGRLRANEAKVLRLFSETEVVGREKIGDELAISRASANRLICRMLARGLIDRDGRTKGCRYRLPKR